MNYTLMSVVVVGGSVLYALLGVFCGRKLMKHRVAEGHNDVLVPIFLTNIPHLVGLPMPVALQKQMELMVFGALIVFFLIVEPNGLARLWQIAKEKLRLWPFPH